ncbi:hypothetical protein L6R49_05445 [Myxococcota bacterium]|nr:hypothetical protein [Myxococcota bacterium]
MIPAVWLIVASFALAQEDTGGIYDDVAPVDEEDAARVGDEPEVERIVGQEAPSMELLILGERQAEQARAEVEARLEAAGYEDGVRRGDKVVYKHPVHWKPRVVVYDEGFMVLRRQPPRVRAPELGNSPANDRPVVKWWPCLIIPTLCVQAGGLVVSPARFERQKELVVQATEEPMRVWADAISDESLADRLSGEIPALLQSIWYDGIDPRTGQALPTFDARRAALLEFWMSRADNRYGDAVREAVELFMAYEVQTSPHPYSEDEIRQANERRTCNRALSLPPPEQTL